MEHERQNEIHGLLQILEQTTEIAENAILTEAYKDAEERCITQFNKTLKRLTEIEAIPNDLFDELQEDAPYSEISIACHHLAAYLNEGLGSFPDLKGMMTNMLGKKFIDDITDEFKESKFGDMIRNAMPDFLKLKTLDNISESFDVRHNGPKKLIIDTELGTIKIHTANTDKVNVFVHRSAHIMSDRLAADMLDDFQVKFIEEGKNLKIDGNFITEKQHWRKIADRIDIGFDVVVPRNRYDIDIKTKKGNITVTDVNGAVECRTANGNLQFQNMTGLLYAFTEKGNVRLDKGKGNIRLETLRGNINISDYTGKVNTVTSGGNLRCTNVVGEINGESSGGFIKIIACKGGAKLDASGGSIDVENDGPITAKTIGGSINANITGQLKDDSVIEASGGDITVSLISAVTAKLDARSGGGEVISTLPIIRTDKDDAESWKLQGVINSEGPLMTLRSVGGDINLKSKP